MIGQSDTEFFGCPRFNDPIALALEILCRALGFAPTVHRIGFQDSDSAFIASTNPILGYELKKNFVPATKFGDYRFSTNEHGQRDVARSLKKGNGVFRILMFGDSVTLGSCLPKLEDTIPARLEAAFGSDRVEVLNFGLTGYSPPAEVELFRTKGVQFEPDLALFLLTANDLERVNKPLAFRRQRPELTEELFVGSSLFRYIALKFDLFSFRSDLDPTAQIMDHERKVAAQTFEQTAKQMKTVADAHGIRVAAALWPAFHDKIFNEDFLFTKTEPKRLVFEGPLSANGIPFFPMNEAFARRFEEMKQANPRLDPIPDGHFTCDTMHSNPNGSREGARILKDWLSTEICNTGEPCRVSTAVLNADG